MDSRLRGNDGYSEIKPPKLERYLLKLPCLPPLLRKGYYPSLG